MRTMTLLAVRLIVARTRDTHVIQRIEALRLDAFAAATPSVPVFRFRKRPAPRTDHYAEVFRLAA